MIFTLRNSLLKVAGAFALLAMLCSPFLVRAQDSLTFSVSPTIFDMTGTPGQTWRSTVRVINVNPYELKLYIVPANFVPKSEEGVPSFKPLTGTPEDENTLAHWISLQNEVIIGPEKTVEVPFTITLPPGATPGGHYAALMISTQPPDSEAKETKVKTSQIISSLIFLRVTGDITENSSVRSFRTSNYIMSKPETTFELRIENKGNVHVQPQGEIKIFNMWGQERGIVPVNQKTLLGNVLPASVRKFSFEWKGEWALADIGRYTAVATLAYGVDTRQFMTADTAFWVIPWKFLLLVFGVVGGFVALMTWAIKLYVRHVLALAGVQPGMKSAPVKSPRTKKTAVVPEEEVLLDTVAKTIKGTKLRTKRMAEAMAPLEAGMLDLRARLGHTETLKAKLVALVSFLKLYWKFFVTIVSIILFLWALGWFLGGALTPTRDFEVTIEENGQSVTVTSDEIKKAEEKSREAAAASSTQAVPVSLVNRSGFETAMGATAQTLERAGYTIKDKSVEAGEPQPKTVIVYQKKHEETALLLSKILDNALLSVLTEGTVSDDDIVIYIGSDAESD